EREGRQREVERPPATERRVAIRARGGERRGQQVGAPAAAEVPQGRQHLPRLEVDQTVAAEDQVDARQRVADDVEASEAVRGVAEALLVGAGERLDHLDADV